MEDTIKPEMVIVKDEQEIKLEEDLAEADPLDTGGDPNLPVRGVINSFSLYDILRFLYTPGQGWGAGKFFSGSGSSFFSQAAPAPVFFSSNILFPTN